MSNTDNVEPKGSVNILTGEVNQPRQNIPSENAESLKPKEETKEPPVSKDKPDPDGAVDELKIIEKEKNRLHYRKLDFIESVLNRGDEYAKDFFSRDENKDLAETANSSMKFKNRYRDLMEREEEIEKPVAPKIKKELSANDEISNDNEISDRIEANILRKQLDRENKLSLREYMVKNGINIDNAESIRKAAESLSNSTGKEFSEVLPAAYAAITGNFEHSKPLNLPSSPSIMPVKDREKEIKRLVDEKQVPKEAAERYLDSMRQDKDDDGNVVGTTFKII